jgi:aldose 1-epimerase
VTASGTQWTITHGDQIAVVTEVGGGLREYRANGVDVLDGYAEDEVCPGGAGQVLAPWPNRLRDGAYKFDGAAHQLPLSEPVRHNAIHGLVRWLPWRLEKQSESELTVELTLHPQPGYPWQLLLQTVYSVGEKGLTAKHSARNLSPDTAPFGFGTHPYVRASLVPINDCQLQVKARSRLLLDSRNLPIGAAKVAGGEFDYSVSRKIGATELDLALGDVIREEDGTSEVIVTAPGGNTVRVWADESFSWWQLFTGDTLAPERQRRSIAIEPMTCPPDALRSGRDLVKLAPGEVWSGEWGIQHGIR